MLADEIGHILVGKPIGPHDLAAAVQDWYLMCLEGDWFNVRRLGSQTPPVRQISINTTDALFGRGMAN